MCKDRRKKVKLSSPSLEDGKESLKVAGKLCDANFGLLGWTMWTLTFLHVLLPRPLPFLGLISSL